MRTLILSDVHGNLEALDACLESAPACDVTVNLGDLVGYSASPNQVVERCRQLCRVVIRGNHDKACAGISDVQGFNPIAAAAVEWTHRRLTPENLEWLRQLPQGPQPIPGAEGIQIVHGAPNDEDEYLLTAEDAAEAAVHVGVPVTFFGHSHMQGGFHIAGRRHTTFRPQFESDDAIATCELQIKNTGVYLLNPGSVGQPRDGDRRAAFAVFDSDVRKLTFFRVPYDVTGAQQRILDAGLPEYLAVRLAYGR